MFNFTERRYRGAPDGSGAKSYFSSFKRVLMFTLYLHTVTFKFLGLCYKNVCAFCRVSTGNLQFPLWKASARFCSALCGFFPIICILSDANRALSWFRFLCEGTQTASWNLKSTTLCSVDV